MNEVHKPFTRIASIVTTLWVKYECNKLFDHEVPKIEVIFNDPLNILVRHRIVVPMLFIYNLLHYRC